MTGTVSATRAASEARRPARQPPLLFTGLAVASIGGPLALVALYLPPILSDAGRSAALVAAAGVTLFIAPTAIWRRYSTRVAGPGGLYAFTSAAVGRRIGLAQAGLWTASYLLYLLYTTDYVVYDVLPAALPGVAPWRPVLEVTVPLVVAAVALAPVRTMLTAVTVSAGVQVVLALALVAAALTRHAGPGPTPPVTSGGSATAAANVALLFICASLPTFLGGEVAGGGQSVRRGLAVSVGGVGALVVLAAVPAGAWHAVAGADLPGVALARGVAGDPLAKAVGIGVAVSVSTLVVVEYVAITRLAHAVTGWPVARVARWLVVPLVVAGVVSLGDPARFYADLLRPSLVTLWLAQLVPVLAYPVYAARTARLRLSDVVATVVATGLVVFGLHASLGAAST